MGVLNNVKVMLQSILEQFTKQVSTDKGLLQYEGDELEVGIRVSIVDEEGNATEAENGVYTLEDGTALTVENGAITEIKEVEVEAEEAEPAEEGGEPAENGENEGGDEPSEPTGDDSGDDSSDEGEDSQDEGESEDENVPENKKKKKFSKIQEIFEESYEEKEAKIISAIRSKGFDCWLIQAGDDFAIVEVWNDVNGDYIHYRFPISWEGEEAIAGDPVEVKSEYVPVNQEPVVEEETFSKEEKEQLENEIASLKAKIEELENKPAANSAKQQFRNQVKTTDNEKLDNFINKYVK